MSDTDGEHKRWLKDHLDKKADEYTRKQARDSGEAVALDKASNEPAELVPLQAPKVSNAMFYGLAGDVMRMASDGAEVHPAAAGMAFLSYAAVSLNRKCEVYVGNGTHHARIYGCHVGRSSVGGKGMALEVTYRIRSAVEADALPGAPVSGHMHDGGLSTREGLAFMIRDESDTQDKDGVPSDLGVSDKRLFIIEQEFANVLAQSQRDGNTLSAALRTAWDGGDLAPATKSNRTRASNPHVGLHCCITPIELAIALNQREMTNGFANRFLFVWAERQGVVPFPRRASAEEVQALAIRLKDAIRFASVGREINASTEALAMYASFYKEHRRGMGLSMQLRGLTERYPPYAWRLSLTFALLDCTDLIGARHMAAALAWLDYCRASTSLIFSSAATEAKAQQAGVLGQRIVGLLDKQAGKMLARERMRETLGKPSARDLDAAIEQLTMAGAIEETSTARVGGGRPLRAYVMKEPQRFERLVRFGAEQGFEQTVERQRFETVCTANDAATVQTVQTAETARFAGSQAGSQTAQTVQAAEVSI